MTPDESITYLKHDRDLGLPATLSELQALRNVAKAAEAHQFADIFDKDEADVFSDEYFRTAYDLTKALKDLDAVQASKP